MVQFAPFITNASHTFIRVHHVPLTVCFFCLPVCMHGLLFASIQNGSVLALIIAPRTSSASRTCAIDSEWVCTRSLPKACSLRGLVRCSINTCGTAEQRTRIQTHRNALSLSCRFWHVPNTISTHGNCPEAPTFIKSGTCGDTRFLIYELQRRICDNRFLFCVV